MASTLPSSLSRWTQLVRWGGLFVLSGGFGLGLLLTVFLLWKAPHLLPVVPILVVGGAAVLYLVRHPFVHLCVVLAGAALILEHEPGIQATEVLYGLYASFFLGLWFFEHLVLRRSNPFDTPDGKAVLGWLVLVVVLLPVSVLYDASARTIFRELSALILLGFYFPIKDACVRYREGVRALALVAAGLALFAVVRNLVTYQTALQSTEYVSQLGSNRVIASVQVLAAASIFSFTFLVYAHRLRDAALHLGLFAVFFAGLILTLSRGFWVAFVMGAGVLFLLADRKRRLRLVVLSGTGLATLLLIGVLFFGDLLVLFIGSVVERIASIGAMSTDLSMLGRYYETEAALARIRANPILGHGVGAPFHFLDVITRTTYVHTFMHNGYVSLWYRFGLLGTGLVLFWWGMGIWNGIRAFRTAWAPPLLRLCALATAATLVAFILSSYTSNPFYHKDYVFTFTYLTGLAAGIWARLQAVGQGRPGLGPASA